MANVRTGWCEDLSKTARNVPGMILKGERLLVIHPGALGDVVTTFPALKALKARYGAIDILCQGRLGKLARYLNIVARAYPLESALFATLFTDSTESTNSPESRIRDLLKPYDAVVLFSLSADLEKNLTGWAKGRVHRIPPRPEPGRRRHVARYILGELTAAGLIDPAEDAETTTPASAGKPHGFRVVSAPASIILHPGSGSPTKNWPLPRFLELAARLLAAGLKPAWILGPAERPMEKAVLQSGMSVEVPDDIISLVKVLNHAAGFVGNDSGVSHLAAFLGLPTVVVFGPSDPLRWAPMGRQVRIVAPIMKKPPSLPNPDCGPCFEKPDEPCRTRDCLDTLTVDSVLNALKQVIPTRFWSSNSR